MQAKRKSQPSIFCAVFALVVYWSCGCVVAQPTQKLTQQNQGQQNQELMNQLKRIQVSMKTLRIEPAASGEASEELARLKRFTTGQKFVLDELQSIVEQISGDQQQNAAANQSQQPSSASSQSTQSGNATDTGAQSGRVAPATGSDRKMNAQLIQDVWGELPPELRSKLKANANPQFVPKYESIIQRYYRRLAK